MLYVQHLFYWVRAPKTLARLSSRVARAYPPSSVGTTTTASWMGVIPSVSARDVVAHDAIFSLPTEVQLYSCSCASPKKDIYDREEEEEDDDAESRIRAYLTNSSYLFTLRTDSRTGDQPRFWYSVLETRPAVNAPFERKLACRCCNCCRT